MAASDLLEKYGRILYPTLLIAAAAVIAFSMIGIAAMTGMMPGVFSGNGTRTAVSEPEPAARRVAPAPLVKTEKVRAAGVPGGAGTTCVDCGVVESIRPVDEGGGGQGVAAVSGAGADSGNEVGKAMEQSMTYEMRIRMSDGTDRTVRERSRPALAVGQKVRVTHDGVAAIGRPVLPE